MIVARQMLLSIAVVCSLLALPVGNSAARSEKSQSEATTAKTLAVTDSVVIKSKVAQFFIHPIKCDGDGNVYLMTQIDATTGIRKLNPKGQRVATFAASSATDLSVWHGTYFAVTPDGMMYQLADLRGSLDRAVIRYNKDGSYRSSVKLQTPRGAQDWTALQIAVFQPGDMLIVGSIYDPDSKVRQTFTGTFDSSGALKREIQFSDDQELQKMAESGDPRVTSPGHEFMNSAVALGRAEAGEDGNIYVMRKISPAILYVISPGGQVLRRFIVDPGETPYVPLVMQMAGSRITILFHEPQTERKVIKIVDLEGNDLVSYTEPVKDGRGLLGSALACYAQNPERFTFLFTSDEGFLGLRIAEPQ